MSLFLRCNKRVDPAVLAKSVHSLPALPELAHRVMELADDVESSPLELLRTISKDPSLAATLLKSVNSAAYGLSRRIDSLTRAVPLLGLKTVANITIAHSMQSLFSSGKIGTHFASRDLWDHSSGVATVARRLVEPFGREQAESAFVTGLLHDIGLVVVMQHHADTICRLVDLAEFDAATPLIQNERAALGFDHADLGMYIAEAWRLPEATCIAVGFHHAPLTAPDSGQWLAAVIAIADQLCCEARHALWVTANGQTPTPELLAAARIDPRVLDEVRQELPALLREAKVARAA